MTSFDNRPKAAVESWTVIGILGTLFTTAGVLLASYEATGSISSPELFAAFTTLAPVAIALKGRIKATRPINRIF